MDRSLKEKYDSELKSSMRASDPDKIRLETENVVMRNKLADF